MNSFEELLSTMAGVPVLAGARCRGRHAIFDPQHHGEPDDVAAQRHAQALTLCESCPALTACESWINSLPPRRRPLGIVAGRLRKQPRRHERTTHD